MNVQTLVVFHDLLTPDSMLLPALQQAHAFDPKQPAYVQVLILAHSPPPPMSSGFGAGGFEIWGQEYTKLTADLEKKKQETTAWIENSLELAGTSFGVDVLIDQAGTIPESIGRWMRYADISVIPGRIDPKNNLWRSALSGAISNTGRALMVLNGSELPKEGCKQVVIGWDGSPSAAIAVRYAIPMMLEADDVQITMVDPVAQTLEFGDEPGAGLGTYLARHNIKATVCRVTSGGNSISEALLRHAMDVDADLIVMGAYSHWRLQDWLFGSTTEQILDGAKCPLLLAH